MFTIVNKCYKNNLVYMHSRRTFLGKLCRSYLRCIFITYTLDQEPLNAYLYQPL